MTHISKAHQRFSNYLNNPRVLEYPEEFLGPNYKAVLDFWLFLDGLTEDQWKTIENRYCDFLNNQRSEWFKARDEAIKASEETIGREFADAAYGAYWTTQELIGMHLILDQQKSLTFLNMFLDL